MEEAQGLVGCRIIALRSLPGLLPRGVDFEQQFVVGRVIGVEPTKSAPRGALRFFARDARNTDGSGYRVINFDDIAEVIGTLGAEAPRKTNREIRQEVLADKRAARREERRVNRKGQIGRGGGSELPPPEPDQEPEVEETSTRRRRRKRVAKGNGADPVAKQHVEPVEEEIQTLSSRRAGRKNRRRRRA